MSAEEQAGTSKKPDDMTLNLIWCLRVVGSFFLVSAATIYAVGGLVVLGMFIARSCVLFHDVLWSAP